MKHSLGDGRRESLGRHDRFQYDAEESTADCTARAGQRRSPTPPLPIGRRYVRSIDTSVVLARASWHLFPTTVTGTSDYGPQPDVRFSLESLSE
jgi:hypothetical protein